MGFDFRAKGLSREWRGRIAFAPLVGDVVLMLGQSHMIENVKGCHHCIGAGYTVSNLVFNFIESWTLANGSLNYDDVGRLKVKFLSNFSSGYDLFERIHRECMQASHASESGPFSRNMILPSLLSACGKRSAKRVFTLEVEYCGNGWIDEFFYGFAGYVCEHYCRNAELRLISAFVEAAGIYKSGLSASKLIGEPKVQSVLFDCVAAFRHPSERDAHADSISAHVNQHIACARKTVGANAARTTSDEIRKFLEMLPVELEIAVSVNHAPEILAS